MAIGASFDNWRYWSDLHLGFSVLPAWAHFALSLGASVARAPDDMGPTLTAVTVPTRAFSAALAATGASWEFNRRGSKRATDDHLAFLRMLAPGKTVWCNYDHRRVDGVFCGIVRDGGDEFVKIETRRGRTTNYTKVPVRDAYRIQLASTDRGIKRSRIVDRIPPRQFAKAVLGADASLDSRLDSVIIGQKSLLVEELSNSRFAVSTDNGHQEGTLQEVVRAIGTGSEAQIETFGSVLETPYEPSVEGLGEPSVAVFDGDRALLLKRTAKTGVTHWVAVLDRTSRRFADACELVDRLYLERRGVFGPEMIPPPPPGVELVGFLRRDVP